MSEVIIGQFMGALDPLTKTQESKAAATQLFKDFIAHQKSGQRLAMSLNKFVTLSGSTYEETAKALGTALNHTFSKGYMSKLNNGGRIWNQFPESQVATDLDKVASISQLPDDQVPGLLSSLNIGSATRAQVSDAVKTLLGQETSTDKKAKEQSEAQDKKPMSKVERYKHALTTLKGLVKDFGDDPAMITTLEHVVNVIVNRIEEATSTEQIAKTA